MERVSVVSGGFGCGSRGDLFGEAACVLDGPEGEECEEEEEDGGDGVTAGDEATL